MKACKHENRHVLQPIGGVICDDCGAKLICSHESRSVDLHGRLMCDECGDEIPLSATGFEDVVKKTRENVTNDVVPHEGSAVTEKELVDWLWNQVNYPYGIARNLLKDFEIRKAREKRFPVYVKGSDDPRTAESIVRQVQETLGVKIDVVYPSGRVVKY